MKFTKRYLLILPSIIVGCASPPPPTGMKIDVLYNDNIAPLKTVADMNPPSVIITSPNISRSLKLIEKSATLSVRGIASSNSGVAKVNINGQEAGLDADGKFWSDVLLKVGDNRITVTVLGVNRKQKVESFIVAREVATPETLLLTASNIESQALISDNSKYYAMVIGINSYRYIDRLQTAVNDAETVARILSKNYDFEVKQFLNEAATRENVMNELNRLRFKLKPNDKLLIYYAGHGVHDKVADASYWLPVDAKNDNDTNWIDAKNVTDQLKRISSKHVLIVADSCYSGTITRSVDTDLKNADTRDNYLRKIQNKAARVLISSGGNEPVADSGGKDHSIFAEVFINALLKPEKSIFTSEELHVNYLKESVAGRADQTPEYKIIRNSGHDGGDFIFVKKR